MTAPFSICASAPYYKDVRFHYFSPIPNRALGLTLLSLAFLSGCNRGAHPAQVGKRAPDFTVSDGTDTVHLAGYRGKVVVLNFWASWCGPCVAETPSLEALHHDLPDLAIVGVSIDEDESAYRGFLNRHRIDIKTVRDPEQNAAKLYHSEAWPETYIIDRQGVIRRKVVGPLDWTNPEIQSYLKSL